MHLRDQEGGISRADGYARGFKALIDSFHNNQNAWTRNVRALIARVNSVAPEPIILGVYKGGSTRYSINPNFRLSDERTDRSHEAMYEFAQIVRGGVLRLPTGDPLTVSAKSPEAPVEITVRDDGAVVVGGPPMHYNPHELNLFNLLLLSDGQPLSYHQLFALGFHPYATRKAQIEAASRAAHTLNTLFGGTSDESVISLQKQKRPQKTYVHLERTLNVTDLRTTNGSTLEEMRPVFRALLDLAA